MTAIEERHLQALRALAEHEVQFVLVGGVALQAHGYSAATDDVDVTIAVGADNERRVDAALQALGAHSPAPGQLGTSFQTRVGKVELLRDTSGVGRYDAWTRGARTMQVADGLSIKVGSPSDVLLAKEVAARTKDDEALPQIRAELLELGALDASDVRGPVAERAAPTTTPDRDERCAQALLGSRPDDAQQAKLWNYSAEQIVDYRARWNITTGPEQPLGAGPADDEQRADRDRLESSLRRSVRMLERDHGCEDPGLQR